MTTYCLTCDKPCSTERIIAVEFWKECHDGRPFFASDGDTHICRYCHKTDAEAARFMWALLPPCSFKTLEAASHITLMLSSGRRTKPILPFSIFPLATTPLRAPEYEPDDLVCDDLPDHDEPPTDLIE